MTEKCKFYERFGAINEECCYSCFFFVDDEPDRYPYCSAGCDRLYFPCDLESDPDLSDLTFFECLTDDLPFQKVPY